MVGLMWWHFNPVMGVKCFHVVYRNLALQHLLLTPTYHCVQDYFNLVYRFFLQVLYQTPLSKRLPFQASNPPPRGYVRIIEQD